MTELNPNKTGLGYFRYYRETRDAVDSRIIELVQTGRTWDQVAEQLKAEEILTPQGEWPTAHWTQVRHIRALRRSNRVRRPRRQGRLPRTREAKPDPRSTIKAVLADVTLTPARKLEVIALLVT
jgi:hypothetical protein